MRRLHLLPILLLAGTGCYPDGTASVPSATGAGVAVADKPTAPPVLSIPAAAPAPSPRMGRLQPPPPDGFTEYIDVTISGISSPLPLLSNGQVFRMRRVPNTSTWQGGTGNILARFIRNEGAGSPDKLIHFHLSEGRMYGPAFGSFKNHWNVNAGLPSSDTVVTNVIDPNDPLRRNAIFYTATLTPVP